MIRRHWILKLSFVILAGMALHGSAEAQFNRAVVGSGSWDNAGSWELGIPSGSHDATIGTGAPGVSPSSITMDGAGTRTSNGLWMGIGTGNSGELIMTNGATLNTGFMNLAEQSNTTVNLNLTDSTLTSGNNLRLAWNSGAVGNITLDNSDLTTASVGLGEGIARNGASATVSLTNGSTWTINGTAQFHFGVNGNAGTKAELILDNSTLQYNVDSFFNNRNATTTNATAGSQIIGNGLIDGAGQAFANNGRVVASGGTLTMQDFFVMTTAVGLSNVEGGFFGSNGWFAADSTGGAKLTLPTQPFGTRQTWGGGNFGNDATPDLVNSVHFNISAAPVTGTLLGSLYSTDHVDVPAGLINPIGVWEFSGLTFGGGSSLQMIIRYDNDHSNLTFDENNLKLFHYTGSTWEEILGTVDTATRLFTSDAGAITSFSLFALAEDTMSAVPEPSTYALGLIGLAALGLAAWRHKRRS